MIDHGDGPYFGDLTPDQLADIVNGVFDQSIPRPVRWDELDATATADALTALNAWVEWLRGRYNLDDTELPHDWWRHGALVEELSALKGAWDMAYDKQAPAIAAAEWHQTLNDTRQRLKQWIGRAHGQE